MSVDLYQPCPGGLDKKIKFCCKDLAHELDRITKLVKADQDKAALDYVERLIQKYPDRQCLLAWNARLKIALVPANDARPAVEQFLHHAPNNAMAHCSMAVVEVRTVDDSEEDPVSAQEAAAKKEGRAVPELSPACGRAIASLQRSVETVEKTIPGHLASAFVMVGRRLFMEGFPIAAREHLGFALTLQGKAENPLGRDDLIESYQTREYPLLVKDSTVIPRPPGHVGWRNEFMAASQEAMRGRWRLAVQRMKDLDARFSNEPAILLAIANLSLRLADNATAVDYLRRFSQLDGVSETDAVYTEALALTLDPPPEAEMVDVLRLIYPVNDANRLSELLLATKRALPVRGDLSEFAEDGSPPPRAAFTILDRDMPESAAGITVDSVPLVIGDVYLFGRETDREARLEADTHGDSRRGEMQSFLETLEGTVANEPSEQEVLESIPSSFAMLTVAWRLPQDAVTDQIERLSAEKQRQLILQQWPNIPQSLLGGKSAREAAKDPACRTRVLALLLAIEGGYMRYLTLDDFDELYRTLELPVPQPRSIFIDDLANSPAVRLSRVDPAPLSDKALLAAYNHAVTVSAPHAIRRFAQEIIRRGTLDGHKVSLHHTYGQLARHAEVTSDAVEWLIKAQNCAMEEGVTPVSHLLTELDLRIRRGEPEETQRVVNRLRLQHWSEPGVAAATRNILGRYGLLKKRTGAAESEGVLADAGAVGPGSEAGGTEKAEGGSKLWLPGDGA
jgi:hypothetical protein